MKYLFVIVFIVAAIISILVYNYNHFSKKEILKLVQSEKPCDRIRGFLAIGDSKDTSLYRLFFTDMRDRRGTHCLKYYGKTVLWAKIEALRKITKADPPSGYEPMTPADTILVFYRSLILQNRKEPATDNVSE